MSESNGHTGLFQSVRSLCRTSAATFQNRIELFAVEFKEQKHHVVQLLVWASAAIFLGLMFLGLLTATLIMIFPPEWRIYAAGGLTFLYLVGLLIAVSKLKSSLKDAPTPFSETISELKKDREWLKNLK